MNKRTNVSDRQTTYNNVISLGFFCSVAQELERYGLRNSSYPFDWLITDCNGVFSAIENHFKDFLNYDDLAQMKVDSKYYINTKYGFQFYHDFNAYQPLIKQLPSVRKKYNRRIDRFYNRVVEPTLFVRYIQDENEMLWIEENYDYVIHLIKSFNMQNSIIFISNNDINSDKFEVFTVEKDINDTVARNPFSKNKDLNILFKNINYRCTDNSEIMKVRKRIIRKFRVLKKKLLLNKKEHPVYIHDKQYP